MPLNETMLKHLNAYKVDSIVTNNDDTVKVTDDARLQACLDFIRSNAPEYKIDFLENWNAQEATIKELSAALSVGGEKLSYDVGWEEESRDFVDEKIIKIKQEDAIRRGVMELVDAIIRRNMYHTEKLTTGSSGGLVSDYEGNIYPRHRVRVSIYLKDPNDPRTGVRHVKETNVSSYNRPIEEVESKHSDAGLPMGTVERTTREIIKKMLMGY